MFIFVETITTIVHVIAVSLGVGSSTLAIVSYLVASKDGTVDQSERRMLGVIFWTLRVSMVLILLTTFALTFFFPMVLNVESYIWILVGVLYLNAICMTKHFISPKLGPGIQAATWYTLGFVLAIGTYGLYTLTYTTFAVLYGVVLFVLIVGVNAIMAALKQSS